MGKLSNLTNNYFNLNDLNFDGFRQSKHWVGYFERKGPFHYDHVERSVSHVIDYFQPDSSFYITLSALSYDDEREQDLTIISDYRDIYNKAKKRRLLHPLTEEYDSFLYGESRLPVADIILGVNDKFTWDLCRLFMIHGGVLGEVLFIAFINHGVIVYPHKDTGFGVISMTHELSHAKDFLKSVSLDEKFSVHM